MTGDVKKEASRKKKRLHPKPLRSKTPSSPPLRPPGINKYLIKMGRRLSYHCKSLPTIVGLVVAAMVKELRHKTIMLPTIP